MEIFANKNWTIWRLVVGEFMVNCYIVIDKNSGEAVVIDPGGDEKEINLVLNRMGLKVVAIINTHGHGDHIGANRAVKTLTGAPILIGEKDAPMLTDPNLNLSRPFGLEVVSPPADRLLREGDRVVVGDGELRVLETPGHSPGSITLVGEGFALVGDLIFAGSIGRTDLPGGDERLLLTMINEKILTMDDRTILLSGHGPTTTVEVEKRSNPFLGGFEWRIPGLNR